MATEKPDTASEALQPTKEEVVILVDQKKNAVDKQEASMAKAKDTKGAAGAAAQEDAQQPADTDSGEKEGMSLVKKVAIGAGVAAAVGVSYALLSGSSDDGPRLPTPEEMVGQWRGQGTSQVDRRTYSGVYTLYAGGSHIYDVYVSDGERHRGRGTWTLSEGTNTLVIKNDTGSVYVGDFLDENFTTISMRTTDGRWALVLTKM